MSFSAPIVVGVVALMLEANPDLGWRDVQREPSGLPSPQAVHAARAQIEDVRAHDAVIEALCTACVALGIGRQTPSTHACSAMHPAASAHAPPGPAVATHVPSTQRPPGAPGYPKKTRVTTAKSGRSTAPLQAM